MNQDDKKFGSSFTWPFFLVLPLLALVYGACSTPKKKSQPEPAPEKTVPRNGTAVLAGYSDSGYLLVRYDGKHTPDRNVAVRPIGIYAPGAGQLAHPNLWDGIEDRPATRACLKEIIENERDSFLQKLKEKRITVELPDENELRKDEDRGYWRAHVYYENEAGKQVNLAEELVRRGLNTVNKFTRFPSIKESLESLQKESKRTKSGCWSCMTPPERFKQNEKEKAQLAENSRQGVVESAKHKEQEKKTETENIDTGQSTDGSKNKKTGKTKKTERKKTKDLTEMTKQEKESEKEGKEQEQSREANQNELARTTGKTEEKKERSDRDRQPNRSKEKAKKKDKSDSGKKYEESHLITDEKYMPNYPGSPKSVRVEKKSENHFRVHFPDGGRSTVGWFLFRAVGLTPGKTYRFDLVNVPNKWRTLNPVFSEPDVDNLKDIEHFVSKPVSQPDQLYESPNGAKIPNTAGQKWHYMRNVKWKDSKNTLVCRQKIKGKQSWIGMRVPFTLEYREAFLEKVQELNKPFVKIHEVGETEEGNPLKIVEIGGLSEKARKNRPTVVWLNQEHPDEHDTSWIGEGVIRFLISDSPKAQKLRSRSNNLVIMLMDPDGTFRSQYKNILHTFRFNSNKNEASKTSIEYGKWFRNWLNKGNRLDIVYNIHNVESAESGGDHLFSYLMESEETRKEVSVKLYRKTVQRLKQHNFDANKNRTGKTGYTFDRLAGFLWFAGRSLQMFYEVNSQAKKHLTLYQLRMIGVHVLKATIDYLHSSNGKILFKSINMKRRKRRQLLSRYSVLENGPLQEADTPFEREDNLWFMNLEEKSRAKGYTVDWVDRLWSHEGRSKKNIPKVSQKLFR